MHGLISVPHDGPAHTDVPVADGTVALDLPEELLRSELEHTYNESSIAFTPMVSSTDPVEFTAAVLSHQKDALRPQSFPVVGIYLRKDGHAYRISGVGTDDSGSIYVTVDEAPLHPGEAPLA
ncbi:hypothetical protein GCM10010988_23010 [Cnuibacter physcomitrellae]|uniref:Uncharacterized protein n=1 Tax=Cnuibacter physcomitrellae TaxID=1619308 RepID=A0A1X9LSS2_9MICO|nr:hypothetical protein [Cnuibacter physcomitrellae]ARJ06961.1 hypothetical protein B5808_18305 [Cnuibacter physcomitrellae]GGI39226.1 hypothetical protein GCM10010988_23010 [Cnuibacter physcomitrellae]